MDQIQIFVILLNSESGFLRFLFTGFKISAWILEKYNNRATGKEKAGVLFSKVDEMFTFNNNCAIQSGFN